MTALALATPPTAPDTIPITPAPLVRENLRHWEAPDAIIGAPADIEQAASDPQAQQQVPVSAAPTVIYIDESDVPMPVAPQRVQSMSIPIEVTDSGDDEAAGQTPSQPAVVEPDGEQADSAPEPTQPAESGQVWFPTPEQPGINASGAEEPGVEYEPAEATMDPPSGAALSQESAPLNTASLDSEEGAGFTSFPTPEAPGPYGALAEDVSPFQATLGAVNAGFMACEGIDPSGTVTSSAVGNPVISGVAVDAYQGGEVKAGAVTDSIGEYRFDAPAGAYQLRAAKTGYVSEYQNIVVADPVVVDFELDPAPTGIYGQLKDTATGLVVSGATVKAEQGAVLIGSTVTNATGDYSLALAAGSYTVSFIKSNYATGTAPVTLSGPYLLNSQITALSYVFEASGGDDQIRVATLGGGIRISSDNASFATRDYAVPPAGSPPESTFEIRGLGGNDSLLIVSLPATFQNRIKFVGGSGTDTIKLERNTHMTLTDTTLTAGSEVFALSGVEVAELVGGANDNTLDASAFGGTAKLWGMVGNDILRGGSGNDFLYGGSGNDELYGGPGNDEISGESGHDKIEGEAGNDLLYGGSGNDVFVFGDGFGLDTVNSGGDTDTLDLAGHTGTLSITSDKTVITSSDGSVLTQVMGLAEKVDFLVGTAQLNSITAAYNKVSDFASRVATGTSALYELANQLPFLGPISALDDGSLAAVMKMTERFAALKDAVAGEVSVLLPGARLSNVVSTLDGLPYVAFTLDYGRGPSGSLEAWLRATYSRSGVTTRALEFGKDARDLGVSVGAIIDISGSVSATLTLSLPQGGATSYFRPGGQVGAKATLAADFIPGVDVNIGILEASITGQALGYTAGVELTILDHNSDGMVLPGELTSVSLAQLISIAKNPDPDTINSNLTLVVKPGVALAGGGTLGSATLNVTGSIFGSSSGPTPLVVTVTSGALDLLSSFNNLSTMELFDVLGQLESAFWTVAGSPGLRQTIPFMSARLGDVLDFAAAYRQRVMEQLLRSNDLRNPDFNGNGVFDVGDLDFSGIQSLVSWLNTEFGVPATARYDVASNEITFTVAYSAQLTTSGISFDFGTSLGDLASIKTTGTVTLNAGVKAELTFGIDLDPASELVITPELFNPSGGEDGILSSAANFEALLYTEPAALVRTLGDGAPGSPGVDESQTVTILNAMGGSFQLAFRRTPSGAIETTDDIPWNVDGPGLLAALEALPNITPGDVAVSKITGSWKDWTYLITFTGSLAASNIPQIMARPEGLLGTITASPRMAVTVPVSVAGTSTESLGRDVQKAVNQKLVAERLTVGFIDAAGSLTTGAKTAAAAAAVASGLPLTSLTHDLAFTVVSSVSGVVKSISGRVRLVDLLATDGNLFKPDLTLDLTELGASISVSRLAEKLQDAIAGVLSRAGLAFGVVMGVSAGKLSFDVTSSPNSTATLEIRFPSPVRVDAGGGRISLSAPASTLTFAALEQGASVGRRIEVFLDYDNTSYKEMGLLSAPTSYDGKTDQTIKFWLEVDGTTYGPIQVAPAATADNTSVNDLVSDLQTAIDAAVGTPGKVVVFRVDPKGNRIGLRGVGISTLAINVPTTSSPEPQGALKEIGFLPGDGETLRSRATAGSSFFFENVSMEASVSVVATSITATATIGFLEVIGAATGMLTGGRFLLASLSIMLKNPLAAVGSAASNRITIDVLDACVRAGKFLYEPGDVDLGDAIPDTGFIYGVMTAAFDLMLSIDVAGVLAGVASDLNASVRFTAGTSDWFRNPLTMSIAYVGPDFAAVLDKFKNMSFADVISALQAVVAFLKKLAGTGQGSGGGGAAQILNYKLPLIERSISEVLDVANRFADILKSFSQNPAGAIQVLEQRIRDAFDIRGPPVFVFNPSTGELSVNLFFGTGTQFSRPFNIDVRDLLDALGLTGTPLEQYVTSLVGVGAGGSLDASASIRFDLKLGIDLLGPNKSVFLRTGPTGTKFTALASVAGNDLSFELRLGPLGLYVVGGSANLSGSIGIQLNDVDGDGRFEIISLNSSGGFSSDLPRILDFLGSGAIAVTGSGAITLPLFIGTADTKVPIDFGDGSPGDSNTFALTIDLIEFLDGDSDNGITVTQQPTFSIDFQLPGLFALLSDPAVFIDGLDRLLKTLQDAISGQIFGVELPLVGDLLKGNPAADFIGQFRSQLLQPLANLIRENNLNLESLLGAIQQKLFDIFGPSGLKLLLDGPDSNTTITKDDIVIRYLDDSGNVVSLLFAKAIQFDFDLGWSDVFTAPPLGFDIGIDALGLSAEFQPEIEIGFKLHMGFGIHSGLGFYFVTDHPTPELSVNVTISLSPDAASRTTVNGRLLFLALKIIDGVDLDGVGGVEDDELSGLTLSGTVDLKDPDNDGKLTFPEMVSASFSDIVQPQLTGGAKLYVSGSLDFSILGPGLGNVLPKVSVDFLLEMGIYANPTEGFVVQPPTAVLANITLDLGSFITDFAAPILGAIGDALEPLGFLIGPDGFLNMRIPLLSDLAGKTITGKDLIVFFDPDNGPKVVAFIEFLEQVYFLADLVTDAAKEAQASGGNLKINFGHLVLTGNQSALQAKYPGLTSTWWDLGIAGDLRDLQNLKNVSLPSGANAPSSVPQAAGGATKQFTAGVTSEGSIEFTLLKAETIFNLLMGKPATFFTVEFPELGFSFFYRQTFPIIGPLVATFGGGVSGGLDLGFGYDSYGLQQFIASGNPAFLLNGFFLNDLDPATGADRNEAWLRAQITVGAAISLALVTAGVEGGVEIGVDFNLADIDGDGKIRASELALNLVANSYNPLAIFDITVFAELFMRAYVEINLFITTIKLEFEFLRLRLFTWEVDFERPGVLASQSGSTLNLHVGPSASARLKGDTTDGNETIYAKMGSGGVIVYSNQFNVPESLANLTPFFGITKIVANGGAGNDIIDLSGIAGSIVCEIRGGDGIDTIKGGAGADLLYGDGGDDYLYGGAGNDKLWGGVGNDHLFGEADADELYGDAGNDTLNGGAGADTLSGGPGNDTFERSADGDTYALSDFGSIETITLTGTDDTLDFSDKPQNLTFFVRDTSIHVGYDQIAGTAGTDISHFNSQVIVTNPDGVAKIIGSDGNDTFYVWSTKAAGITLDGHTGNDTYIFYVGTPTLKVTVDDQGNPWNLQDVIKIEGTGGVDTITLTSTTIAFGSGQLVTYVEPGAAANVLSIKIYGHNGNDTINVEGTAKNVPVRVEAGAGNDQVKVGGSTVNGILQRMLPGLNAPFGLGPLVVVGGSGHDSIIVDDSGDSADNTGNITAFLEKRNTSVALIEVGVVSGLGMTIDQEGTTRDGRVEFEGFEAVEVKLGSGADKFTIGGAFDLRKYLPGGATNPNGGFGNPELLVDMEFPKNRLAEDDTPASYGIKTIVNTIKGMTVVSAGGGNDTINVIATNDLDSAVYTRSHLNTALNLLSVATQTNGGTGVNEVQNVTASSAARNVGYFTLKFRFMETRPIPFGASAATVREALEALYLIRTGNVKVDKIGDVYRIEFINGLKELNTAQLVAQVAPMAVFGGAGVDRFNVQWLDQTTFFNGEAGADVVYLNVNVAQVPLPTPPNPLTGNGVNAEITLDGGPDGDWYYINLVGGTIASLINVFDSGALASGTDSLIVYGTNNPDLFLLRAGAADEALAFIALLNSDSSKAATNQPVERVNYNINLESIVVEGRDGDDQFYVDDTRAVITINAGKGKDFFQVGQLYKTRRTDTLAGVRPEDIYSTIETTKGWLSNGVSNPMTINGDEDDDLFIVFHNLATLTLNGWGGDDTFIIQAFALAGSQEDKRALTDLSGDAGADTVMYAVNAPVNINGGDGFDTVIIIGTEFKDDFVVTKNGVYGAGLNVNFVNIEILEIDGAEGNDRFFVLGTGEEFATVITGGLGTDFFFLNGPTPKNGVISNDLLGHSAVLTHYVTSSVADAAYEGLKVIGVSANVADNDEPMIVIRESGGFSSVVTAGDGDVDSYTVTLARPPRSIPGTTTVVVVSVIPPRGLVLLDPGTMLPLYGPTGEAAGRTLSFDSTNWYIPQTVYFKVDESFLTSAGFSYGDILDIQHRVLSNDAVNGAVLYASNGDYLPEAPEEIAPNPADTPWQVIYEGKLTKNPLEGIFPPKDPNGFPESLRGSYVKISAGLPGGEPGSDDAVGQIIMIMDVLDEYDALGDPGTDGVFDTLVLARPWDFVPQEGCSFQISMFTSVQLPNVRVSVFTEKKPQIVVHESDGPGALTTGGSTEVAEGANPFGSGADYVDVRLSQQPTANVTVSLTSSLMGPFGQLRFFDVGGTEITSLTFTHTDYKTYQRVRVVAADDAVVEGFHWADMKFAASGGGYDTSRTIGVFIADNDWHGVRIVETDGSTDVIEYHDGAFGVSRATADAAGFPYKDSYHVVLTKAPGASETVTVTVVSEATRATRTGGIRSYEQQVEISSDGVNYTTGLLYLTFTAADWDTPQTVYVRAIDDLRVDGSDTQVFAPTLDQINSVRGPLYIYGGLGKDRTGLLEREPVMLPYEWNIKPGMGKAKGAGEAVGETPAYILIDPTEISASEMTSLGIDPPVLTPADLITLTIEITEGPAKNKVRIITGVEIISPTLWKLEINRPWYSPFPSPGFPNGNFSIPSTESSYTLAVTNPNLLVKEADMTDRMMVLDTDNPASWDDPALYPAYRNHFAEARLFFETSTAFGDQDPESGQNPLDMYRLVGLGMGGDRVIGGDSPKAQLHPGGITFKDIEQTEITLGDGNNYFIIDDTPLGLTTLNTRGGNDTVELRRISGHTIVNLGSGNDTATVASLDQQLDEMLALLTLAGDTPEVAIDVLVKGSEATADVPAVDEEQRIVVHATGGTFALSFRGSMTAQMPYNVSAAAMKAALEALPTIGAGDVSVLKAGFTYRVVFGGSLAGTDVPLLLAHDLTLTNGLGSHDVLVVDGSGSATPSVTVLTSSTLTGMDFSQVNEVQTVVVDATGGMFALSYKGSYTGNLPHDVSAAAMKAALEALPDIGVGDVAVTKNDDVYSIRFQGSLDGTDAAQIGVVNVSLTKTTEPEAGSVVTNPGSVRSSTRTQGSMLPYRNDMQSLTVNATGGRYALSFEAMGRIYTTEPIRYDASADEVRAALQWAIAVVEGGDSPDAVVRRNLLFDVTVDRYRNVYLVGFQGIFRKLEGGQGVNLLSVDTSALVGNVAVTTRMDGINYYGFETVDIRMGQGADVLNIQGTTSGSNGFSAAGGIAATNIWANAGNEQVYVSSSADLDFDSILGFDFLTGHLDDVNGTLNLDVGIGRHRLMISDEAAVLGDATGVASDREGTPVVITDVGTNVPGGIASRRLAANAEIWMTGLNGVRTLPEGGISYRAASAGNFFDGIVYWSGWGPDHIWIDGTHVRPGERTTTMLNTGMGDDRVTVDLDTGEDDFFVLNTMGGAWSPTPAAGLGFSIGDASGDDDWVDASASTLPLLIFGGIGRDEITSGSGNDLIFGDFGRVWYFHPTTGARVAAAGFGGRGDFTSSLIVDAKLAYVVDRSLGGDDIIRGANGEDVIVGGPGSDRLDGGMDRDLIFGDNVSLDRRGALYLDYTDPRYRMQRGTDPIYGTVVPESGQALVDAVAQLVPLTGYSAQRVWGDWEIWLLDHSRAVELDPQNRFGADYIAGGGHNDTIFGQLGNDTIQGDGSIDSLAVDAAAWRNPDGTLTVRPSFEAATDGDDYIEGGGGNDTIFGGLGQDDIVGGNSSLFSLGTRELRPDGADIIFGGSGVRIDRNHQVTVSTKGTIVLEERHARDSDAIAGDNADIFRLVAANNPTSYRSYAYDASSAAEARGSLRIVVRPIKLLDYTPGGPDYNAAGAATDVGAADEIHGESGDDFIYGMVGGDILFGESEDDDIVGGWGHDWISGGTGQDGVLGDDGRIFTSRNGTAEPLFGLVATTQQYIYTPGKMQQATINVTGRLKKTVDLTPFNLDPTGFTGGIQSPIFDPTYADDIIYGGWGSDFLHGGPGDDAISGAEALEMYYLRPFNPGDVLGYGRNKAGEFAAYDEYFPRRKVFVDATGDWVMEGGIPFLLNFNTAEGPLVSADGYPDKASDGDDVIFGDLGNDWLVGGSGRDNLYGGYGDDLLNVDDDHDSVPGSRANDVPDTHPSYEDRAYGGAGRDILIANTGGDRLIDWVGEFNSYIVPFAPFGMATVSRTLQPQLAEFLYALSAADGADPTRATDTGADPARNGEPEGELGMVRQKDLDWQDQTGAPADPQAGNIPGGPRDVLRSASFNQGNTDGFSPDSGTWKVSAGRLEVAPEKLGSDAVSVFYVDAYLPRYYEVAATINAAKPTGGYKSNAYLIFDYQHALDFKFAGVNISTNKLELGYRDASGWHVVVQSNGRLRSDTDYRLLLSVNGTYVTIIVDGRTTMAYTFAPRVDADGFVHALNEGMVGLGADNSKARIDNVAVQVLPPDVKFVRSTDFAKAPTDVLQAPTAGSWTLGKKLYTASSPVGEAPAVCLSSIAVDPAYLVDLTADFGTTGSGGFVFDRYSATDFKFVFVNAATGRIEIGHTSKRTGWVVDASVPLPTSATASGLKLNVVLQGNLVTVSVNGVKVASIAFFALVTDGAFGLASRGTTTFTSFRVATNDPEPTISPQVIP